MADKVYTLSDGTIIDDKVAEQITQDVYAALDRGEYKVITDQVRAKSKVIPKYQVKLSDTS